MEQYCQCGCGRPLRTHTGAGRAIQYATTACRVRAHRAQQRRPSQTLRNVLPAPIRHMGAPFPYFGGKQGLLPILLPLVPPHRRYIETHGGAASLLFSKEPAPHEIYNDADHALYRFFTVLRDQGDQLKALLDLSPCSREEYRCCMETWREAPSDLEAARRWFVVVSQGFSSHVNRSGWSFSVERNTAKEYRSMVDRLPYFTARLARVVIECVDFARLFEIYDGPEALFYCDPPYLPSTRRRGRYLCEMTEADHQRLLEVITSARGKVILSGYRSEVYDTALADWARIDIPTVNWASNTEREKRVECVWLSPNIARQPTLWAV